MNGNKLAVIVSGPIRYIELLVNNLNKYIVHEVEYDIFIHLWRDDLGDKKRLGTDVDFNSIIFNEKVKNITFAKAYCREDIGNRFGDWTGCPSPINAMVGMFHGIDLLLNMICALPDADDYTHVLRLRTDMLFFNPIVEPILLSDKVHLASNPRIPKGHLCDHMMLAPIAEFRKIWAIGCYSKFMEQFDLVGRHPEKFLHERIKELCLTNKISFTWKRYINYHIVYNPCKLDEPKFINKLISKDSTMKLLYSYSLTNDDKKELYKTYKNLGQSFQAKVKRRIKRCFIN